MEKTKNNNFIDRQTDRQTDTLSLKAYSFFAVTKLNIAKILKRRTGY